MPGGRDAPRVVRACLLLVALWAAPVAAQVRGGSELGPQYPHEIVPIDAVRGHLMEGLFSEPLGVHFDGEHRELFVVDSKNGLIGIYDELGVPLFTFGGHRLLLDPKHVEVGADGSIYVLDAVQTQLKVFNYRGEPRSPLVFRDPDADLADDEQRAQDANTDDAATSGAGGATTVPEPGRSPSESGVVRIGAFTLGPQGRFYVADLDRPRVLVYDDGLELLQRIEPAEGEADFSVISGMDVSPEGLLAVVDFKARPVQVFDADGRFVRGFGAREIAREDFTAPISVAFDGEGFLFVVDMLRHDVKIFTVEGEYAASFGGWFTPETGGRSPGEMLYPASISLAPEGLLYVAERFGNRVQVFERMSHEEASKRRRMPRGGVGR